MNKVCKPSKQPQYPQPGNLLSSILLQNPKYPIPYYINSFNQKKNLLTKRTTKRLKKDKEFTKTIFKSPETTLLNLNGTY